MWEAAAIVLATVLYLVDKNQKWRTFWYVCIAAVAVAAVGLGSVLLYDRHDSPQAKQPTKAEVMPPLPAGYTLDAPAPPKTKWHPPAMTAKNNATQISTAMRMKYPEIYQLGHDLGYPDDEIGEAIIEDPVATYNFLHTEKSKLKPTLH